MNLLEFSKRMESLSKKVSSAASKEAEEIALYTLQILHDDTPVDTSKAVSNWVLSVGIPSIDDIDAHVPGKKGSTAAASKAIGMSQAKAKLKNRVAGQTIYISNAAPYIRKLNDGWSMQAAAGFIELAVMLAKRKAKLTRVNIKL